MGRRALAAGAAVGLCAALAWVGVTAQVGPTPEAAAQNGAMPGAAPQAGPVPGAGQSSSPDAAELVERGARLYARNCSPCHGARMQDPQGAFDLRQFPHDQPERFRESVQHGKNQMPAWGAVLKPDDIDALWAYVVGAEGSHDR
jgi:mono/diheme cytochrome c family protein